jgi:hypothetical protein
MHPSDMPITGDVLFTRGPSFFNRLTCKLTGPASHQAIFYDQGYIVEASAQTGRIERVECNQVFSELAERKAEWIVFHWVRPPMNECLKAMVQCDLLEAAHFERYSYIELPLQVMDCVINRYVLRRPLQGLDTRVFRKLGDIWENGVICSKTSNNALIKNGFIQKSTELEYGSPSDTYRYLKSRVNTDVMILDYSKGWFDFSGA